MKRFLVWTSTSLPVLLVLCLLVPLARAQNARAPASVRPVPKAGVIVFATTSDSTQPLAQFHGDTITGGILMDLGAAVAAELHRQVMYAVIPRKRLDMELQEGLVDGVCYYRPEWVSVTLNWSRPFIPNDILLVGREGVSAPKRIEDLQGKTIGTVLGYKYPELDALHDNYLRDDAPNMESNIRKLAFARTDYAIVDKLSLDYFRKMDHSIGAVSSLFVTRIIASCGFSQRSQIPFGEVDAAINNMVKKGTVDKILAKYR